MQSLCAFDGVAQHQSPLEKRREPRFEFEGPALLRLPSGRLVPVRTLDISESGFAAIVVDDLEPGHRVELIIDLPDTRLQTLAIVRNRTAFRYGFEFLHPEAAIKRMITVLTFQR